MVEAANPEFRRWQGRYETGDTPWDTGRPSTMLMQAVAEEKITPCRALELGCGTGTNAVWLAQQGFEVVGVDLSPLAIEKARQRALGEGVSVQFVAADLFDPPALAEPFPFVFDRGCYHVLRKIDSKRFFDTVQRVTSPGSLMLVLAGNAKEPMDPGPPVVSEQEFRLEWGVLFDVLWLREFRFDQPASFPGFCPLAWAGFLRRKTR
jgi:SAM-dependent methyltransferase